MLFIIALVIIFVFIVGVQVFLWCNILDGIAKQYKFLRALKAFIPIMQKEEEINKGYT